MLPCLVTADTIRIATFHASLSRDGPGLLYADILDGAEEVAAIASVIAYVRPNVISLTDFDYDVDLLALQAFQAELGRHGLVLPYRFASLPNSGRPSGIDADGDDRLGEPEDAVGYGRFWGDGGIAVLSRWPMREGRFLARDRTWGEIATELPDLPQAGELAKLPASTSGHLAIEIDHPEAAFLLLSGASTAPVFDGPMDRNGYRNAAELLLWREIVSELEGPFVLAFNANLDPADGEGHRDEMVSFLALPQVQDPEPKSAGGALAANADHNGDPSMDTVDWRDPVPGNLRVSYVLPSQHWRIVDSGVFWPEPDDSDFAFLGEDGLGAGAHRLVWVDVEMNAATVGGQD